MKLVFLTELLLLCRRSQVWVYPLAFFIMVISLFPLSFSPDPQFLKTFIPGGIWMAALLASLLSLENIFLTDLEEGYLEQMALANAPLTFLLTAKLGAYWVASSLPLLVLTPLIGWIFGVSLPVILALGAGLVLGTPILTLVGSLGAALTLGLRQGVFLGLLILPLLMPILILGVTAVQQTALGFFPAGPLLFLGGMLILSLILLPMATAWVVQLSFED